MPPEPFDFLEYARGLSGGGTPAPPLVVPEEEAPAEPFDAASWARNLEPDASWPPADWVTESVGEPRAPMGPSVEEMGAPGIPLPDPPSGPSGPPPQGPMGPPAPTARASRPSPAGPPGAPGGAPVGPQPGAFPGPAPAPGLDIDWNAPLAGLGGADAPGTPAGGSQPRDPFAAPGGPDGELEDPFAVDRQADQLLRGGEEAIAADRVNRDADRREYLARLQQQELEASGRQAAKNLGTWQKAAARARTDSEALRADYRRLSETPIDRKRWYANQSVPGQMGAWIAALAGSLTSVYNGGRNGGIDFVIGEMDKDVEIQKENLQARKQGVQMELDAVAQEYARHGDEFRAVEAVRMANLDQLDKMLAAKAAQFDPVGTRAQALAGARMEVRQRQAKAIQEAEERMHKRAMEDAELQIRQDTLVEQRRARQAAAGEARRARQDAEARWAFEKGAIRGPDGNWIMDPARAKEAVDPQTALAQSRHERVQQDIQHGNEERVVQGVKGKPMGRARSPVAAENMRQRVAAYNRHQTEINELANMLSNPDGTPKKFYQGPGWEHVKNPERDAIMAKALNVLYLQAKINDPTTGVKDAEIKFGMNIVPFVQGLTSGKSPRAQATAILEQADTDLISHQDAEIIGGSGGIPEDADPVRAWKKTRGAIEEAREKTTGAQTDEQAFAGLTAKIAEGTPPAARKEFIDGKVGVIERWAKDEPWKIQGLDADLLKEKWEADTSLTPKDRTRLTEALDDATARTRGAYRPNPGILAPRAVNEAYLEDSTAEPEED